MVDEHHYKAGFYSTQGRKNSKLKEKTQNSSKKLKVAASFGVVKCKNQLKGPKNGENSQNSIIKDKTFKTLLNGYNFKAKIFCF